MNGTIARATTAAALSIAGAQTADATTVINLPMGAILANDEGTSGVFNISSFLSNQAGEQFKVSNASVQLGAFSNFGATASVYAGYNQTYAYTAYYTYRESYSCGGWLSSRTCYRDVSVPYTAYASYPVYTTIDGVVDRLTLAAAGASVSAQTENSSAGYYGGLLATLDLSGSQLDEINRSGTLNFTATASTNTNVNLSNATLSFDLVQIRSAVPEPTTWAMMITGFAAVGAATRLGRRRKRTILA